MYILLVVLQPLSLLAGFIERGALPSPGQALAARGRISLRAHVSAVGATRIDQHRQQ